MPLDADAGIVLAHILSSIQLEVKEASGLLEPLCSGLTAKHDDVRKCLHDLSDPASALVRSPSLVLCHAAPPSRVST